MQEMLPVIDSDIEKLAQMIRQCQASIKGTRCLITEYLRLFELTMQSLDEDGNEIIKM